jgi:hypothetical protein
MGGFPMTALQVREPDSYGPAMMALPNDRQRAFVIALVTGQPGHGCLARAYLAAGYEPANRDNAGKAAHKLSRDERVLAAIAEESKKIFRAHHPEVALALLNLIRNPDHKDHARAIGMVLDRVDPATTTHAMTVTHKVVDPDQEALQELRAARHIGATREKLIELFGSNGLERLEALEAAENAQRAAAAKLIEGTVQDVK